MLAGIATAGEEALRGDPLSFHSQIIRHHFHRMMQYLPYKNKKNKGQ